MHTKHNLTIISAASPSPANPKMVKLYNHTAQTSSSHKCAEDGHLKCPDLPNIDGDIWLDWWLIFCWFWVWQTSDAQLAR